MNDRTSGDGRRRRVFDVNGPARRALRVVPGEPDQDQVLRLTRFRREHPDVIAGPGEFGTWQARIPEPDGEIVVVRHTLRDMLDRLDRLIDVMSPAGGRFPAGSPAVTPYPLTREQEDGDRAAWPWLPATVAGQVGPDEWEIVIEDRRVAKLEDGVTPAPEGTAEDDLCHPVVFRDSSEIRPAENSATSSKSDGRASGGRGR